MDFLTFASNSPFLGAFFVYMAVKGTTLSIARVIRHLNIRKAGWPPGHVDADGDLVKKGGDA